MDKDQAVILAIQREVEYLINSTLRYNFWNIYARLKRMIWPIATVRRLAEGVQDRAHCGLQVKRSRLPHIIG